MESIVSVSTTVSNTAKLTLKKISSRFLFIYIGVYTYQNATWSTSVSY